MIRKKLIYQKLWSQTEKHLEFGDSIKADENETESQGKHEFVKRTSGCFLLQGPNNYVQHGLSLIHLLSQLTAISPRQHDLPYLPNVAVLSTKIQMPLNHTSLNIQKAV